MYIAYLVVVGRGPVPDRCAHQAGTVLLLILLVVYSSSSEFSGISGINCGSVSQLLR